MQTSVAAQAGAVPNVRTAALPWYVVAMAVGATSIVIGVIWDISWHSTIGRDSFWTPAHIAIYLGGVVGGLCGGWLAIKTTFFGTPAEKASAVRFWGFRAPLGAWVAIWGSIAMITSAPFDDWWHNAYGLDVEILSPPHTLLALGMFGVTLGALLLAVAQQNQRLATEGTPTAASCTGFGLNYAYLAGVTLALVAIMGTEYRWTHIQHSGEFYLVSSAVFPLFLIGLASAARLRWPATAVAFFYMAINVAMIWILPLFSAEPKLAPIHNPVTHMVVDCWPLFLLIPAVAIDVISRWWGDRGDWRLTVLLATTFLGFFVLTQWNISRFLISDSAHNWFFAGDKIWSYNSSPGEYQTRFWRLERDPLTVGKLGIALALAMVSRRLGLWWARGLARVKR